MVPPPPRLAHAVAALLLVFVCGTAAVATAANDGTVQLSAEDLRQQALRDSIFQQHRSAAFAKPETAARTHHEHDIVAPHPSISPAGLHKNGGHAYRFHAWLSQNANTTVHPRMIDIETLPGLVDPASVAHSGCEHRRSEGDRSYRLRLAFKDRASAEAAQRRIGAQLRHHDPSNIRGGEHTPIRIRGCVEQTQPKQWAKPRVLVPYHSEIAADTTTTTTTTLEVTARGALPHEQYGKGVHGGYEMAPMRLPSEAEALHHASVQGAAMRRAAKPQADAVTLTWPFQDGNRYVSGGGYTTASVSFSVDENVCGVPTACWVGIADNSGWSPSWTWTKLSSASLRTGDVTLPKVNSKQYIVGSKCTCGGTDAYTSTFKIVIVNYDAPNEMVIVEPEVFDLYVPVSQISIAMIAAAGTGSSASTIALHRYDWLPTSGDTVVHTWKNVDLSAKNPTFTIKLVDVTFPTSLVNPRYYITVSDGSCSSSWLSSACPYSADFFITSALDMAVNVDQKVLFDVNCASCASVSQYLCTLCSKAGSGFDVSAKATYSAAGTLNMALQRYSFDVSLSYALQLDAVIEGTMDTEIRFEASMTKTWSFDPYFPSVAFSRDITLLGTLTCNVDVGTIKILVDGKLEARFLAGAAVRVGVGVFKSNFITASSSMYMIGDSYFRPSYTVAGKITTGLKISVVFAAEVAISGYYIRSNAEGYFRAAAAVQYPAFPANSAATTASGCTVSHWAEVDLAFGWSAEALAYDLPWIGSYNAPVVGEEYPVPFRRCWFEASSVNSVRTATVYVDVKDAATLADSLVQFRAKVAKNNNVPLGAVTATASSSSSLQRRVANALAATPYTVEVLPSLSGTPSTSTYTNSAAVSSVDLAATFGTFSTNVFSSAAVTPVPPATPSPYAACNNDCNMCTRSASGGCNKYYCKDTGVCVGACTDCSAQAQCASTPTDCPATPAPPAITPVPAAVTPAPVAATPAPGSSVATSTAPRTTSTSGSNASSLSASSSADDASAIGTGGLIGIIVGAVVAVVAIGGAVAFVLLRKRGESNGADGAAADTDNARQRGGQNDYELAAMMLGSAAQPTTCNVDI